VVAAVAVAVAGIAGIVGGGRESTSIDSAFTGNPNDGVGVGVAVAVVDAAAGVVVAVVVGRGGCEGAVAVEGGAGRASSGRAAGSGSACPAPTAPMDPNEGGEAGSGINCRKMRLTANTAWYCLKKIKNKNNNNKKTLSANHLAFNW
jgi:hypothetical protein